MDISEEKRNYVVGTMIVLLGMIITTTLLLQDSEYLTEMYFVLLAGIIWFLILVPSFLFSDPFERRELSE